MIQRRVWPWAIAAALLPSLLLSVHVATRFGGDVSAIYYVTRPVFEQTVLAEHYDEAEFAFHETPYDSAIFLVLANDPTLHASRELNPSDLFYRARRMAWPWAAWALGAGQPRAQLYTLPLATVLSIGAAAFALGRLLVAQGRHPAWVLSLGLSLGAAVCLIRPLADGFATSWMLLGLCAWQVRRHGLAAAAFTVAALTKETTIIAPAILGVAHLIGRRPFREAAGLLLVPTTVMAWWFHLASITRQVDMGSAGLGLPFTGLLEVIPRLVGHHPHEILGVAATLLAMSTVSIARRPDWSATRIIALAFTFLGLASSDEVWVEVWSYGRVQMTIPAIGLFLYATRGRALDGVGPLAAGVAAASLWFHAL